jgi:hypothetical protein
MTASQNPNNTPKECTPREPIGTFTIKQEKKGSISLKDLGNLNSVDVAYDYPGLECNDQEGLSNILCILWIGNSSYGTIVSVDPQKNINGKVSFFPTPPSIGEMLTVQVKIYAVYNDRDVVLSGLRRQVTIIA